VIPKNINFNKVSGTKLRYYWCSAPYAFLIR
jgi:hypothetical protein